MKGRSIKYNKNLVNVAATLLIIIGPYSSESSASVSDLKKQQKVVDAMRRVRDDLQATDGMSNSSQNTTMALALGRELHALSGNPIPLSVEDTSQLYGAIDRITDNELGLIDPNNYLDVPEVRALFGLPNRDPVAKISEKFDEAYQYSSPIIFDLNGDGVESVPVSQGVYFDIDGDGFAEKTGWVSSYDGLLAIDLNNNEIIDNGLELFGNQELQWEGPRHGSRKLHVANGFEKLALYDKNGDALIDQNDDVFDQLVIWKDDNTDGVTDIGELHELAEFGIISIGLHYYNLDLPKQDAVESQLAIEPQYLELPFGVSTSNPIDINGNAHLQIGNYSTLINSSNYAIDVWFYIQSHFSYSVREYEQDSHIEEHYPDLKGYGTVPSLQNYISQVGVGEFTSLIDLFVAEDTTIHERLTIIDSIIYHWSGVDAGDVDALVSDYDSRQIFAIEKFMGRDWFNINNGDIRPYPGQANMLKEAYLNLRDIVYSQLAARSYLADIFGVIYFEWDVGKDVLVPNLSAVGSAILATAGDNTTKRTEVLLEFLLCLKSLGFAENINRQSLIDGLVGFSESEITMIDLLDYDEGMYTEFNSFYSLYLSLGVGSSSDDVMSSRDNGSTIYGLGGDDSIYGYNDDDIVYGGTGFDFISGGSGNDYIYGEDEEDNLYGEGGNDYLFGGDGDDFLYGESGHDELDGGRGDDELSGYSGNDTYYFGEGYEKDVIFENWGVDKVILVGQINSELVSIYRDEYNLYLDLGNTKDILVVDYFYSGNAFKIESVEFEGDVIFSSSDLNNAPRVGSAYSDYISGNGSANVLLGLQGDDDIEGKGGDDRLEGGEGDDRIYGGAGSDILIGGPGNDFINGQRGSDIIYFGTGDGQDSIKQADSTTNFSDVLFFYDIDAISSLNFSYEGIDLLISIGSSDDSVRVLNWKANPKYKLDGLKLKNGSFYDTAEMESFIQ